MKVTRRNGFGRFLAVLLCAAVFLSAAGVTVLAQEDPGYTVVYDANGGYFTQYDSDTEKTVRGGASFEQTYAPGDEITLGYIPSHDDDHLSFVGWYYDEACSDPVDDSAPVKAEREMHLYAGYAQCYLVTYDAGEDEKFCTGERFVTQKVFPGDTLGTVLMYWNENFERFLACWCTDAELTQTLHTRSQDGEALEIRPQGDMTLYAKWRRAVGSAQANANGGFYEDGAAVLDLSGARGYPFSGGFPFMEEEILLPEPKNKDPDKKFTGYFLDEQCTVPFSGDSEEFPVTGLNESIVFYAGWSPEKKQYEVTEVLGGASGDGEAQWLRGGEEGLSFRIDAELSKLRGVSVDGQNLSDTSFGASEGSTVITLKPDYLDTLSAGTHTLSVLFEDGEATGTLTVSEEPAGTQESSEMSSEESSEEPSEESSEESSGESAPDSSEEPSEESSQVSDAASAEEPSAESSDSSSGMTPESSASQAPETSQEDMPDTGDTAEVSLWSAVFFLSLAALAVLMAAWRRKAEN